MDSRSGAGREAWLWERVLDIGGCGAGIGLCPDRGRTADLASLAVNTNIHPSALISDEAELGGDVVVGPYAVIEGPVRIGDGCRIGSHAQLVGDVEVGDGCTIGRGAIVGEDPQDLGFDPETPSGVRIGRGNVFREYVTVHRSGSEGRNTTVGEENFLMAGVHLGHDVTLGDGNVLANNCLIAGHVEVGNRVFLGGGTGVHQFVRVGDYCLTQGNSGLTKDLPPYVVSHQINQFGGINSVGLRRAGFDGEARREIRRVVQVLLRDAKPLKKALAELAGQAWGEPAQKLIDFVAAESRKGVLRVPGRS